MASSIKAEASESVSALKVNGTTYSVSQRPEYIKANMNGKFGWVSVWADTVPNLLLRVKQALRGGQ